MRTHKIFKIIGKYPFFLGIFWSLPFFERIRLFSMDKKTFFHVVCDYHFTALEGKTLTHIVFLRVIVVKINCDTTSKVCHFNLIYLFTISLTLTSKRYKSLLYYQIHLIDFLRCLLDNLNYVLKSFKGPIFR